MAAKKEKIVLGSGSIYMMEYDGVVPEVEDIEKEENRLGHVSGGASVEYTPEYYTATDDFGMVAKTIVTKEEALLKGGICTWCGDTLKKLCSTARVTIEGNERIVKIGGAGNQDGKSYVILFAHKDKQDGNIYVLIVGRNQAAITIAFAKDAETVINPEFKAEPQDDEGTLIKYIEEIAATLSIKSVAGTTSGKTALTVAPSLTSGNSYKYKTGASVTMPAVGDVCSSGYTNWDGNSEIAATSGQTIVIVEVDADNKAVAVGSATVVVAE